MSKEHFLKVYTASQIVVGFFVIIFVSIFATQMPATAIGNVVPTFLALRIEEASGYYRVLNIPLFIFMSLLILNVFMMIRVKNTNEIEQKFLKNVVFYNTLLSFMLLLGHLAFLFMLPEGISFDGG